VEFLCTAKVEIARKLGWNLLVLVVILVLVIENGTIENEDEGEDDAVAASPASPRCDRRASVCADKAVRAPLVAASPRCDLGENLSDLYVQTGRAWRTQIDPGHQS